MYSVYTAVPAVVCTFQKQRTRHQSWYLQPEERHTPAWLFTSLAVSTGRVRGFGMNTEQENKNEDIQDSTAGS